MKPVITQSQPYESVSLTRLKQAEREENRVSGQQERLRCSLNDTRRQAEVTATNGEESVSKVPRQLDQAKVAYQEWQAIYTRLQSYRGAVSTGESYQGSFAKRVCGYESQEASGHQKGQTVFVTA